MENEQKDNEQKNSSISENKPEIDLDTQQFRKLSQLSFRSLAIITVILVLVIASLAYGTVAIRLFVGLGLIYILPLYFILSYFQLETIEKLFLSLFSAFGIIPMSVYYLSKIFGSLRISLIVTFVILSLIALFLNRNSAHWKRLFNSFFPVKKDRKQS